MLSSAVSLEQTSIPPMEAAPTEPVVVLLLGGARRFLGELLQAVEARSPSEKERTVGRILPILEALLDDLDPQGGEMSINMARLYDWWAFEIQAAAMVEAPDRLLKVDAQMGEILDGWLQRATAKTA